ncbi:MAG: folate family ECF transporter S component [Oscillospiraceae bacterium]|nr:folate family ECF transporter S component [Oscillospiraceae bacterium]
MRNNRCSAAALKDVRVLTLAAMLVALSIVLGKLLSVTAGPFRISFENLPVLMAGIFLGPAAGCLTGIVADLVGCLIVGYAINPIITVGAGCIGLLAGLLFRTLPDQPIRHLPEHTFRVFASVMAAHIVGSMLIKSAGLMLYYHYTLFQVALRVPLYLVIGTAESLIIVGLLSNSAFASQIGRFRKDE